MTLRIVILATCMIAPAHVATSAAVVPDAVGKPVASQSNQAVSDFESTLREGRYPWYKRADDTPRPLRPPTPQVDGSAAGSIVSFLAWIMLLPALLFLLFRLVAATQEEIDLPPLEPEVMPRASFTPLPVAADGSRNYCAAAVNAAESGDYKVAIVCLFNHQLITLNRNNLIRLDKSGSNRKYARQIRNAKARRAFQESARIFETVFFGGRDADAGLFAQLQGFQGQLESSLPQTAAAPGSVVPATAIALLFLLLVGCGRNTVEYGHSYGKSVNGSNVFYRYLEDRGHQVERMYDFNEEIMANADVLIVFNHYEGALPFLTASVLDEWLRAVPGRVALHIVRDYEVQRDHPSIIAAGNTTTGQFVSGNSTFATWSPLAMPDHYPVVTIDPLSKGASAKAKLFHTRELLPGPADTVLLSTTGGDFVARRPVGDSEIIVIASGAFLLNYSLAESADNRIIAANLAARLGDKRRIFFVEGRQRTNRESAPAKQWDARNPFAFLFVQPMNWLVLHWLLVGILYLLYKSPLFGRARDPASVNHREFADHIQAYGNLLRHTDNSVYAGEIIRNYLETVRRKADRNERK